VGGRKLEGLKTWEKLKDEEGAGVVHSSMLLGCKVK